ncbi:MAG: hypothetical protein GYB33_19190 [Gammaproteobacteria bacterium]|uniref:hypothetical protein n=1 Tax=Pseudomaricurvus alcaniphilus TaxID=1166482 RepID=UPI00140DB09E|nr:hypothetical protein [Pseudomaricurvus alcaniphilus]MBR9912471.1 hypothetical protein [Gammaproteobacteria bacterium]NHN37413.1 hypothetical protein [Pseudomaricurvus alcaniphilus]
MKLSAEITMYPLQEDYRPRIRAFIDELAHNTSVKRETFPTCTVLTGDYDELMQLLGDTMKWSHDTLGKAAFVVKFLPGYEAL